MRGEDKIMAEEIQVNREWDFEVNLSGLVAPTGKGSQVPEGYYQVKLTDLYVNPEKNPNRVIIKMAIATGPFTGAVRTTGLGRPTSPDDKVRYYWRGLAESAGYDPTQLDKGEIRLGASSFLGKTAYIYFKPKDGEGTYEDVDFLPPAEWAQQKQGFDATAGSDSTPATKSAEPVVTQTGPTTLGGGEAPTKADLKAKLGL
jgi:hypothetical protein